MNTLATLATTPVRAAVTSAAGRPCLSTNAITDLDALFPFRYGAGRPSGHRSSTSAALVHDEHRLVHDLRGHLAVIAAQCHLDSPTEYEDYVADLCDPNAGKFPARAGARSTWLLHAYADYIPAPNCEFVGGAHAGVGGAPLLAWSHESGDVVVDIVTTATLISHLPGEESRRVQQAYDHGVARYGHTFLGARHIVLDAHSKSVWYPAYGDPEPLPASDLYPVAHTSEVIGATAGQTSPAASSLPVTCLPFRVHVDSPRESLAIQAHQVTTAIVSDLHTARPDTRLQIVRAQMPHLNPDTPPTMDRDEALADITDMVCVYADLFVPSAAAAPVSLPEIDDGLAWSHPNVGVFFDILVAGAADAEAQIVDRYLAVETARLLHNGRATYAHRFAGIRIVTVDEPQRSLKVSPTGCVYRLSTTDLDPWHIELGQVTA